MPKTAPPATFMTALHSLRLANCPLGLSRREVPAPPHLAPYSVAIGLDTAPKDSQSDGAASTLVILYDDSQSEVWGGDFRLVGHLRTQIDTEMSDDPLLGEFFWVALLDQLRRHAPDATGAVGTVTKELSQTFGGLSLRGSYLNVELRCSWSTDGPDLGNHLIGWSEFVLESAGLPTDKHHGFEVRGDA